MKRTIALLLAALMLAACVSCTGGSSPAPTAAPTAGAQYTAAPGTAEAPTARPTLDPARQAFDPYTDNDNRNVSFTDCAMIDTEDAYYLYANDYIMYYDKIMEDSGFLCPHPECEHDEKFNNKDCVAYAPMELPSMTYYEGKLWWVGYPDYMHMGIFRMDLDGSSKELLKSWAINDEGTPFHGWTLFYFHRGRLFWIDLLQEVTDGMPYNKALFGWIGLDDFELHFFFERKSFFNLQPTMRFAGDSVYIFVDYDGIGPGDQDIPNRDTDEEGYLAWRETVKMTDEVLRWDPTMDEPETVYLNNEDSCFGSFNDYYVSQEGEIYFRETKLEDPEREWKQGENDYITYINRVVGYSEKERVLELTDEDGVHYNMYAMTCGVIVAMDVEFIRGRGEEVHGIWILTLDGETLCRGELPMQYREKYRDRERVNENGKALPVLHGLGNLHNCWATRSEVLFCFEETYYNDSPIHGDSTYYDFIKYEITEDGLVEIPLASCRAHYSDEGW